MQMPTAQRPPAFRGQPVTRRVALCLASVLLAVIVQRAAAAAESIIAIDNFTFSPPLLTVPAGTTVTWVNRDDIPHRIAGKEGSFKSPTLDTDEKFSHTFTAPGTVDYFCSIHTHMTGKIIVTP